MANGSDGSLVIDTELDNDGFEKGSDKLLSSVDNLAKQVNNLGQEMRNAFSGITSILQSMAAAANNAASGAGNSAQQATQAAGAAQQAAEAQAQAAQQTAQTQTQAAQQTAQAQAKTAAATKKAAAATQSYDKDLARLQKQINTAKNNLSGYYQELANIGQSTDEMLAQVSDGPVAASQVDNILEIEKIQIDALNEKYKTKLDILRQLEIQYQNIAAARDAAERDAAAQQAAQVQTPTGDTQSAASAVQALDSKLASLRSRIAEVQASLDEYRQKVAAVKQATDEALKGVADGPDAESQVDALLENEKNQIKELNAEYLRNLQIMGQLKEEHAQVASARVAASQADASVSVDGAASAAVDGVSAVAEGAAPKIGLFTQALAGMISKLQGAYAPAEMTARAVSSFQSTLKGLGSAAAQAAKGVAKIAFKAVAAGAKKAVSALKSFVAQAKKTVFGTNDLVRSLTSLRTMLVSRVKRLFISAVFGDIQEGLKQLALFDSSFNDKMSNIKNSLTQLSGNISVTVGNLISALEPVINTIIDLLNKAVTAVNQFFAVLGGKSTYTAAKKGNEKYAESAEEAAAAQKKFNAELYSFDELNRQSRQDDAGGSDIDESAIQFEELPVDLPMGVQDWINDLKSAWSAGDWYGVGEVIAEGLNAALEFVDNWINNVLRPKGVEWAYRAGEILNGLFDNVDWALLGKTVADGCNAIADIVNNFLTTFRAKDFGSGIGTAIKSWFDNIDWTLIGETFANGWNLLIHTIEGIVTTPGIWASIGTSVGAFIKSWFTTIDINSIATSLIAILNGVTEMVKAFLDQNPFAGVAEKIAGAINRVLHEVNWGELGRTLGNLFLNALRSLLTFVQQMDWQQLGRSVGEFLAGIDWAGILATVAQLIWEAAKAALETLVGLLKGLGPEMILAAISAVVAVIAAKIAGATLLAPVISALGTALTTIVTGICTAIAGWPAVVIAAAAAALAALIIWIKNGGAEVIAGWWQGMKEALSGMGTWIKEHIVDPFVDWFKNLFGIHSPSTVMAEQGGHIISGLLQGITEKWSSITDFLSNAVSNLKEFLSGKWQELSANAKEKWENLKTNVTTAFENARTKIRDTATQIGSSLSSKWGEIRSNAQSAWDNVKSTVANAFNNARNAVNTTASNMRSNLSSTFSGIVSNAQTAWGNLQSVTNSKFSSLQQNVMKAWQNLRNNLNNVKWNNIGHNLVAGLNNGVSGAWGGFMSNVSNMVNNLIRRIKSLFGIHSPSKVFAEIGEFLDMGLEQGMNDGERSLLSTAKNIATAVTDGMTPDSPNVQMNVDSVVGSMQAIISSLGSLAVTFQTIANALTSIGGFTLPNIAAGTVVPYQTKVAANAAPAGAEGGVEAYLLGILSELQALSRSMRNGDGSQPQNISISIGGREVFQVVVDENNRAIRSYGKSPLKV